MICKSNEITLKNNKHPDTYRSGCFILIYFPFVLNHSTLLKVPKLILYFLPILTQDIDLYKKSSYISGIITNLVGSISFTHFLLQPTDSVASPATLGNNQRPFRQISQTTWKLPPTRAEYKKYPHPVPLHCHFQSTCL
jgi:hypothetical protein